MVPNSEDCTWYDRSLVPSRSCVGIALRSVLCASDHVFDPQPYLFQRLGILARLQSSQCRRNLRLSDLGSRFRWLVSRRKLDCEQLYRLRNMERELHRGAYGFPRNDCLLRRSSSRQSAAYAHDRVGAVFHGSRQHSPGA